MSSQDFFGAFTYQGPPFTTEESWWASAFPSYNHTSLPFGNMTLSSQSSPFGKYQPPTWFPLGPSSALHNHYSLSSSGSPWVHHALDVRPAVGVLCVTQDIAWGLPDSPLGGLALKHTLSKASSNLLSHKYRLRRKDFLVLFSVWFLIFVLRFCSASLCLSASKPKPAVFICGSFISMKPGDFSRSFCVLNNQEGSSHGHKGRTGVRKTQTHRGPTIAVPLTWMTGKNN